MATARSGGSSSASRQLVWQQPRLARAEIKLNDTKFDVAPLSDDVMTPSQRARHACEGARDARWRKAAPQVPSVKPARPYVDPHAWPRPQAQPPRPRPRPLPPAAHFPLFHTRHAEESAERPRLVTVVRPCGQSTLRKVTVLLNRRGVVSFEQLLLDVSEALGFPRWHRSRVTRLYTSHAAEIKGVCDFFRGEVAFIALGRARPDLSAVQEALEELFPLHTHYRAEALQAWERRLRPAPDKAAKADSGYSEGTDDSESHQEPQRDQDARAQPPRPRRTHDGKKSESRKTPLQPNHLQRLHLRGGAREPSAIGPLKVRGGESRCEADVPSLCQTCRGRGARPQAGGQGLDPFSGRVPLPPVSRKQTGSCNVGQEVRRVPVSPPRPISREEEDGRGGLLQLSDHEIGEGRPLTPSQMTFDPISDSPDVTPEEIERRYDLGAVVGDGNFAVVRECRRRADGRHLAVKVVERCKLIGREHMMQNELSLLGSLRHPRVVRLFAHHHTRTHSYLVMELVSGGDLFEAISDRGKFPEAEAALMVSDVSEALNYIHCKSIVHRDVKPENLLIEREAAGVCRLKLGDFGLAMVVTEPVFTICGTPTYVAPEILCETGYGVEVDVWALGVILYILLCGFPPFRSRDRDQEELFQLIKQGQLHFLPPYWDTISDEAKGLVRGLVQPEPTERLTAAQTLLHPWVKTMASLCRQRALSDNSRGNAGGSGAATEAERLQSPTLSDAAERRWQGGTTDSELSPPGGRQEPGSGLTEVDGPDAPHPQPEFSEREQVPGSRATGLSEEYKQRLSDPPSTPESQSEESPRRSPPPPAEQQQIKKKPAT